MRWIPTNTREQQEQTRREHPLNARFYGKVTCNWQSLQNGHGCGVTWLTASCVSDGIRQDETAKGILTHYGLDETKAWSFHRSSCLPLGESITLTHPLTGEVYTLTVHELEQQELPERLFPDANMEYPNHLLAMSYSLEPDITGRGFMIQDCGDGDKPRRKKRDPNEFGPVAFAHAAAIGVIGGADGPTAVIVGAHTPKVHAACSALRFEAVEEVEWRAVFSEKLMEEVEVQLI